MCAIGMANALNINVVFGVRLPQNPAITLH